MYQGKKQSFDWTFCLGVADLVAVLAAFPAAWFLVFWLGLLGGVESPASMLEKYWLNHLAYTALILTAFVHLRCYRWRAFSRPLASASKLILSLLAAGVVFLAFRLLFGSKDPTFFLRLLLAFNAVCFALVLSGRVFCRWLLMDALRVIPVERIAFIGWSNQMERLIESLRRDMGRFQEVVGYFNGRSLSGPPPPDTFHNLGNLEDMDEIFGQTKITVLYVLESRIDYPRLRKIAALCAKHVVGLKIIPSAFKIFSSRLSLRVVSGVPVMGILSLPYDQFQNRAAKRALDIGCSLLGLLASAPIIAVLAVLIKRESPGPVFFRQKRVGLNGKIFEIVKLRSMRLDAEKSIGATWAVENDPRRLKIGEFMRERNLDELPQFWNVLKGEMSMVGPRPERPEFVASFEDSVTYYNLRHSCKPGVSGWAAVHGLRGNTSLEDRIAYDLFYIEHWSLWLDIEIMFLTLLPPKNAY
ncbi:MAG: sugar transferase [Verrucomicrobiae bacterium]